MNSTQPQTQRDAIEVLLVEDNEDEVSIALRAFARHGIRRYVRVLSDGAQALEHLRKLRESPEHAPIPRAIFLDLRMPGIDGMRVLREVRKHELTRHVPVIVVSSTQRRSEIEECYRLGANSFISKRYGDQVPGEFLAEALRYWLTLNDVAR